MIDDPLIGRQLANFRVERLIGRGGMAAVYYGQDVRLRRPVAIKVIDARFRDNPTYAERFVREAQTIATWRNDHVVHIHYAGDEGGLYYFVMEYIEGTDLGKYLARCAARHERVPHKEVIRIGRAIADALDYAHQRGVIHRDVKPANVLLSDDNRIVLTDFGLAMDVQQGSFGEVFGSSLYVAPEQARRSADAVAQSDQYALGVILYQMLTNVLPFDDPSPASVALQHLTRTPPPPRQINPALNAETEAVLLKVLSKAPADRYARCRDLIDALEQSLGLATANLKTVPSKSTLLGAGDETLLGMQLDEYRLEALLGSGGMARVYRARDTQLNRLAAIKVIDVPFRADADYEARFRREAQAIAQLDHPNIVRLYRYGEVSGVLYMAMQYVEGRDLETILEENLKQGTRLPSERIKRVVTDVCAALDYAHAKGVIHRDVKPANILIDSTGRAILTDFGLALLVDTGTRGEIFGSPFYIAPEQAISSANVTRQSDLYSMGVIVYEMFTGRPPFMADNPLDIALLHMTETPRLPSQLNSQITPQLDAVILKALAKEPNERYQTGAELVNALDEALQATVVAAPIVPTPSKEYTLPPIPAAVAVPTIKPATEAAALPTPRRRSRKPVVILELLLLLALLAGGGYVLRQNNALGFLEALLPASVTATPRPRATATLANRIPTAMKSGGVLTASIAGPSLTLTSTLKSSVTATATLPAPTKTQQPTATRRTPTPTASPSRTSTAVPATSTRLPASITPTPVVQVIAKPHYLTYLPVIFNRYRAPRR